jgi:hypothetical protein
VPSIVTNTYRIMSEKINKIKELAHGREYALECPATLLLKTSRPDKMRCSRNYYQINLSGKKISLRVGKRSHGIKMGNDSSGPVDVRLYSSIVHTALFYGCEDRGYFR